MENRIREWISIAKKYGAVFENVDFMVDKGGVKTIAIDQTKEFYIRVPKPIIVPREAIELNENSHYVSKSFVKEDDVREFLNEYLDFILSDKRRAGHKEFLKLFSSLPRSLKGKLKGFNIIKPFQKIDEIDIKDSLISSRTLNKKGKPTFMPFIDFLNHNFIDGVSYDGGEEDIEVKGKPSKSGEIFARYNAGDSFSFLNTYYFPDKSPFTYSKRLGFKLEDGKILRIERVFKEKNSKYPSLRVPKFIIQDNSIILFSVWLGSKNTPRKPFWSFKKVWEDELRRYDTVKVFSMIKSFNIQALVEILEELEELEENLATKMVKEATLNQLKVIGNSFEDI